VRVLLRDAHHLLAAHDLRLQVGHRALAFQLLPLLLRLALHVVGPLQLVRDLAVGLRLHQLRGGTMSPISVSMHSTS
jgi:hypothetical protein